MKSNIPKHPCTDKCTDFKEEQCKTCLIPSNSMELESTENDFLIGDVVVLDQTRMNFNGIYQITEVYENMVDVYIGIGILTLNKKFVRPASITELNAKRRLTETEQALAEVS